MAGTERLKRTAMFVPIEEGFHRKSNHSRKESRCQTKRNMSPGAENRSRCALLTLSVPLRPGRFLAAKIEFSYGAGQTVNLLALRLQWFESTPAQAFPKAILQVFKPFGGQLGISFPVSDTNPFAVSPERSVLVLFDDQSSMTIKTAGAAPVSPGTKVKSIRKAKADSKIEFESGSTVAIRTPIESSAPPTEDTPWQQPHE